MAQLLLISAETELLPHDNIDDIVGIFDDKHKFSDEEKRVFNIKFVHGTRLDIAYKLDANNPEKVWVYKNRKYEWSFEPPEKEDDEIDSQLVWKKDDKWYFLNERPKHFHTLSNLIESEKTLLESSLTSSEKDEAYLKMTKSIDIPANQFEATIIDTGRVTRG